MSCYIIAEAGVNHNGDLTLAKDLVSAAKLAGADAIKFQTFRSTDMVTNSASKAGYQQERTDKAESQLEMLQKLELNLEAHQQLKQLADDIEIDFLSTPFDFASINMLVDELGLQKLKVSSGDLTNGPLLLRLARTGLPLIVSTGMATMAEVEQALQVLAFGYINSTDVPNPTALLESYSSDEGREALLHNVTLLHCTSEYPAPIESVNLRVMDTLREVFGLSVGYSDHTPGIAVALAAAARGGVVLEKHFTLNKLLPGPDHAASLEVDEFKNLVDGIRAIDVALGSSIKAPSAAELANREVARKKLVAAKSIQSGELFGDENITFKRTQGGVSAMKYWECRGHKAMRHYEPDDVIQWWGI